MIIKISANPVIQPCGCRQWDEVLNDNWIHRFFYCETHRVKP